MDLVQALLMGVVQGLSEFLPISSSAHLVFTSNFYKIFVGVEDFYGSNQEVFIDIMLHLGTLIAVLIFFRKDIMNICNALYLGIKTKEYTADFKTGIYIILGTIMTIITALPLEKFAKKIVFIPELAGGLLLVTGFLLLLSEYVSKRIKTGKPLNTVSAIVIGIAQGIASLPGFSRSGLTIASGMLSGMNRTEAARYSFLLSIPVILGASMIYPLVKIDMKEILTYNWIAIILGTIVSGIVGYFCIKYFLKFVQKFSLGFFGYYCLLMGTFAIGFFMWR